jgi:hypothetical protein
MFFSIKITRQSRGTKKFSREVKLLKITIFQNSGGARASLDTPGSAPEHIYVAIIGFISTIYTI